MKKSLLLSMIMCCMLIAYYIPKGLVENGTSYIYPLDDTYIHLSIAKHLCFDHVWGITKYAFSSTSSSPLYTSLLAICMKIGGDNACYPLALNILFILGSIYLIFCYLKTYHNPMLTCFASIMVLLFTPLHVQVLSGMEHSLHIFGVLSIIYLFRAAQFDSFLARNSCYLYLVLCFFSLARYENMFLILSIGFVSICMGNIKKGMAILVAGFFPIIAFGCYSIEQGGFFLPNSLIAKSNTLQATGTYIEQMIPIVKNGLIVLQANKQIRFLGYLLLISFFYFGNFQRFQTFFKQNAVNLIVFLTFILHILFAGFGWLYRYESYLLVLACLVVAPMIVDALHLPLLYENILAKNYFDMTKKILTLIFFVLFSKYSLIRLYESHKTLQYASQNIYQQQIQSSRFLQKYYPTASVVANDIGAITYYSDIHLVDLVGLGSNSVLKAKLKKENFPIENTDIAIIYDSWYKHLMPASSHKIAEWQISNNVMCGSDKVAFYAINPAYQASLKTHLNDFQAFLPVGVKYFP